MEPKFPTPGTQEGRVLRVLLEPQGQWINKQYFVRAMFLIQAGRAIHNLENKYHWKIEHSPFTDEHGFKRFGFSGSHSLDPSCCPPNCIKQIVASDVVDVTVL